MLNIQDNEFARLVRFIKSRYGIDLTGKKSLVQSKLTNYVEDCGFRSFEDYLNVIRDDESGREMANLINRLTTNHTYFMRESDHFDHFKNVFLPEMERTVTDHDLRIWSAGCSFGNEPYNLAMFMDEYFGFRQSAWDLKILATDISFDALRSATRGVYTRQAIEALPEEWQRKYFIPIQHDLFKVSDRIHRNVIFKYHNLMDEISFKQPFDLILCRNVMIYFDDQTKSELCKRFYDATEPGGYLYIGHAEMPPEDIPYKKEKTAVYRKEVGEG